MVLHVKSWHLLLAKKWCSGIDGYNTACFKGPSFVPYYYCTYPLCEQQQHTKEPIIYDICRKWWAPTGSRGRIYYLRVLFFWFFFPRVVGRALRIASPKRSPLFFLWRLCVLVSLSLPLTSVLSFQKQKSHTSKSKEKKKKKTR